MLNASTVEEIINNFYRLIRVEGKELLESVTSYRVPLARATWFTKIVGINRMYLKQVIEI